MPCPSLLKGGGEADREGNSKANAKPRGSKIKHLRGKDIWRTKISGLGGPPIPSSGHFSRGAFVRKLVADFQIARKTLHSILKRSQQTLRLLLGSVQGLPTMNRFEGVSRACLPWGRESKSLG